MICLVCLCLILKKPFSFFCSPQPQALLPQDKPSAFVIQRLVLVSLKSSGYGTVAKCKVTKDKLNQEKNQPFLVLVLFLGIGQASSKLALSTSPLSSSSSSLSFTRFLIFLWRYDHLLTSSSPFLKGLQYQRKISII